jgi:hypothetical protein
MIVAIVPVIVAIVGLLIYVMSTTNVKLTEIGRILFFCGVLVSVWVAAEHMVRV